MKSILAAFTAATCIAQVPQPRVSWICDLVAGPIAIAPGASWRTMNCTSSAIPIFGVSGPSLVNVIDVDLSSPALRLVPVTAQDSAKVASINRIADCDDRELIAGINGGYFWRVDVSTFFDDVCFGKTRADAEMPASATNRNAGIGDGVTVANGTLLSSNCNCSGYNRPSVITINGTSTRIDVLTQGAAPPAGLALDSIGAGTYLLGTNASGTFIGIPADDGLIGNILEHSARAAFGLTADGHAHMVTFDGHDGCKLLDPTCGSNAFDVAYYMRDALNCTSAMDMDGGGSATMWIKGQPNGGIVSNKGAGPRAVYNGLFILQNSQ